MKDNFNNLFDGCTKLISVPFHGLLCEYDIYRADVESGDSLYYIVNDNGKKIIINENNIIFTDIKAVWVVNPKDEKIDELKQIIPEYFL